MTLIYQVVESAINLGVAVSAELQTQVSIFFCIKCWHHKCNVIGQGVITPLEIASSPWLLFFYQYSSTNDIDHTQIDLGRLF
jgi:hypothetical protein